MGLLILSIVSEGLKFLNESRAQELQERIIKLREAFNEQLSKGTMRDDALVDMYERELLDLGHLFLASLKSASSKD